MNYISEVAKMLGVELGEEFEIVMLNTNCWAKAYLNENNGLAITDCNVSDTLNWKVYELTHLLTGTHTIKRKPWKPKLDEYYWHIDVDGSHHLTAWQGVSFDRNYYKLGKCYQTAEEAKANRDKWVAFYKTDEVLEV